MTCLEKNECKDSVHDHCRAAARELDASYKIIEEAYNWARAHHVAFGTNNLIEMVIDHANMITEARAAVRMMETGHSEDA